MIWRHGKMKKQDKNKDMGEPVGLFTVNFITGIKVRGKKFIGRRDQFESAMISYNQYLRGHDNWDYLDCTEPKHVYDWINHVLAGSYAIGNMAALEIPGKVSIEQGVQYNISLVDALFYMLDTVEHIKDEGFHFKAESRGCCFEMAFGWGEIQMHLTATDTPELFQILEINMGSSEYVTTAISQALVRAGLTDKFGHVADIMNNISPAYSFEQFKNDEYGLLYKEDVFTEFGCGMREMAYLRYLYEQKNEYNRDMQIEVCGNFMIVEFNYTENGLLRMIISLNEQERLFRVYKLPYQS